MLVDDVAQILRACGAEVPTGPVEVRTPISGEVIGRVAFGDAGSMREAVGRAAEAFEAWRAVPAPRRGEFVRVLGEELRAGREALGRLVSIEAGKVLSEGLGEVQEMIDICDFAVGLSRQLGGLALPSERVDHRLLEQWHPAGVVGVISAFNFPVAVWSWNAALALVCGDPVVWKPSEKTPLCALAVDGLVRRAAASFGAEAPAGLCSVVLGGAEAGAALVGDGRVPVVSATGSTRMGRAVGPVLAGRFARGILELGGNNASIVCKSASIELAVRAIAFGAMGTAGQRCTTLRRLFVHEAVLEEVVGRLERVWAGVSVGDPLEAGTLVGPLIDGAAGEAMEAALEEARGFGAVVCGGERVRVAGREGGVYRRPALVRMGRQEGPMLRETFAPILYVVRVGGLEEAIALQNAVAQGLSSSIFTNDLREAERFLSAAGSDCGIANVNMGTSGAEIGGAFGGEKETGGGRESGSDSWKAYMRRMTSAVNYGNALPLAQGVTFDVTAGEAPGGGTPV